MTNPFKHSPKPKMSYFLRGERKKGNFRGKRFNILSYIYLYNKEVFFMATGSKNKIIHYPQLDTVLMVEEFIKEHSGSIRKEHCGNIYQKK